MQAAACRSGERLCGQLARSGRDGFGELPPRSPGGGWARGRASRCARRPAGARVSLGADGRASAGQRLPGPERGGAACRARGSAARGGAGAPWRRPARTGSLGARPRPRMAGRLPPQRRRMGPTVGRGGAGSRPLRPRPRCQLRCPWPRRRRRGRRWPGGGFVQPRTRSRPLRRRWRLGPPPLPPGLSEGRRAAARDRVLRCPRSVLAGLPVRRPASVLVGLPARRLRWASGRLRPGLPGRSCLPLRLHPDHRCRWQRPRCRRRPPTRWLPPWRPQHPPALSPGLQPRHRWTPCRCGRRLHLLRLLERIDTRARSRRHPRIQRSPKRLFPAQALNSWSELRRGWCAAC